MRSGIPPIGTDVIAWAESMRRWLGRSWDKLTFRQTGATATEDGVLMWDAEGFPVVSKGGEWRQIVLADGYAVFNQDIDITAAAPDTAYNIAWDAAAMSDGITLSGSPTSIITFEEAGQYLVAFAAQVSSSTASTVNFRFWPALNGTSVTGSALVFSTHNNGKTAVVSRTNIFNIAAGDYIQARWAVDDVNGHLRAHTATAYAPSAPSARLAIVRVRQ